DVSTGGSLPAPEGARGHVGTIALSPNGRGLLACSPYETGGVRLWDLSSGRQTAFLAGQDCYPAAALAPDGKMFAARTCRAGPVLADAVNGKVVWRCEAKGRYGPCALAFSPDGKLLAGTECRDQTIRIHLWDPATGKEVAAADPIAQPGDWSPALSY